MTHDEAYYQAEKKIEEAWLLIASELDVTNPLNLVFFPRSRMD